MSVSDKVLPTVSDKAINPVGVDDELLARIAKLATRARGEGNKARKQLLFPPLRRVYAKERRDAQTGDITRKGKSYSYDIWKYLTTWGYRIGNDLQGIGQPLPSQEQFAELFEQRIFDRAVTYSAYDGKGAGLETDAVLQMADDAASATIRDWSPDYIQLQRERGRTGGKNSKRPPSSWDDADLDVLALFAGLPPMEQLDLFNEGRTKPVSRATYYRMRAALRERS